MSTITNVLDWLNQTSIIWIAVLGLFSKLLQPLFSQLANSAKNKRAANAYTFMAQAAEDAVALASTYYDKSSAEKNAQAIKLVSAGLKANGINIDGDRISAAVERAYQSFTATDTKSQANQTVFNQELAATEKELTNIEQAAANVDENGEPVDIEPVEPAEPVDAEPSDLEPKEGDGNA